METLNDMLALYAAVKAQSDDLSLLFADAKMPDGVNYVDLAGTIIVQYGTCPVMVSDTKQFKYMSDLFFRAWYDNFSRVTAAMIKEYDPIENYDRKENWVDKNKGETKNTGTIGNSGGSNGTNGKTGSDAITNKDSGSDIVTNKVSAYNQVGYTDNTQDTTQYGKNNNQTTTYGSTESLTSSSHNTQTNDLKQSDDYTNSHYGRIHGNIGVTTSQQMLQAEIDLRIKNNIYDMIASKWADTMLLSTW